MVTAGCAVDGLHIMGNFKHMHRLLIAKILVSRDGLVSKSSRG